MNKDIQNENYDLNVSEFYELYLIMPSRKSRDFSYGMDRLTMILVDSN